LRKRGAGGPGFDLAEITTAAGAPPLRQAQGRLLQRKDGAPAESAAAMSMNHSQLVATLIERCGRRLIPVLLLCPSLQAIGVPNLRIDDLIARSDLIVVADVTEIKVIGPAPPIEFRGQRLGATEYSSGLLVHEAIKGVASSRINVRYALPLSFVGYQGLHTGTRIAFLRRAEGAYELADPYYSDFPAVFAEKGDITSSGHVQDYAAKVITEMLNVVSSPAATEQEKSEILAVDYAFPRSGQVIEAFRVGIANAQGADLHQRLQGELISFGDITEIPKVVQLLAANAATPDQRVWLLYVIGNRIDNAHAIGDLRPLLRSRDARLREVAAQALWNIKSSAALADLAPLLHDSDEQVRFFAVRALSDIANEPEWSGPGESQFREYEQAYLNHWEHWLKAQGVQ